MPGRYSPMPIRSSHRNGNSMWRSATTAMSVRTRPTRRSSSCPIRRAATGEVRNATFGAAQPKAHVALQAHRRSDVLRGLESWIPQRRLQPDRRGRCSERGRQKGVNDLFQAEIADTYGSGFQERVPRPPAVCCKSECLPHRFDTTVISSSTSTPIRPRIWAISTPRTRAPRSLTAHPTERLDLYAQPSATPTAGSPAMADPTVIGNQAPLVSRNTINAGAQYRQPLGNGLSATVRLDYNQIGRTWWEPYNITSRDPVSLVDLRLGSRRRSGRSRHGRRIYQQEIQCGVLPGQRRWRRLPMAGIAAALRARLRLSAFDSEENLMATLSKLPSRLHHNAYVTRDLEATR